MTVVQTIMYAQILGDYDGDINYVDDFGRNDTII